MIIELSIFNQSFKVDCEPTEEESLRQTARLLDQKLISAKSSAPRTTTERIAILVALDMMQSRDKLQQQLDSIQLENCQKILTSMIEQGEKLLVGEMAL